MENEKVRIEMEKSRLAFENLKSESSKAAGDVGGRVLDDDEGPIQYDEPSQSYLSSVSGSPILKKLT